MSFSEFVDFGDDAPSDSQCAEHPHFPMSDDCMICAFIHYTSEHAAGATQVAGIPDLPSSGAPEEPYRGIDSDETKPNPSLQGIQMLGTSDVSTTRYPESLTNEFWSNATQQNPFQDPFPSATGHAIPAVKYSKRQNTARVGKHPQPPRKRLYQTALQLAMRHMAPMEPTVKRSYRSSFRPKIISTVILSTTPAQIDIDPRLLNDHYAERLALSPTDFPERFAKPALPAGQECKSEEDAEYEIDLETAKATEAVHESKEEKMEAMHNLADYSQLFSLTVSVLRKLLQSRGLVTGGKKTDLIARLLEFVPTAGELPAIVVEGKRIKKSSKKPSRISRRSTRSSKTTEKGTTRTPKLSPKQSLSSASRIASDRKRSTE